MQIAVVICSLQRRVSLTGKFRACVRGTILTPLHFYNLANQRMYLKECLTISKLFQISSDFKQISSTHNPLYRWSQYSHSISHRHYLDSPIDCRQRSLLSISHRSLFLPILFVAVFYQQRSFSSSYIAGLFREITSSFYRMSLHINERFLSEIMISLEISLCRCIGECQCRRYDC